MVYQTPGSQRKDKYKRQKKQEEYIEPHKHCAGPGCWNMIPETEQYCSPECEHRATFKEKRSKKSIFMIVGVYAVLIVVFILFAFVFS